jgi:hypothetical protein
MAINQTILENEKQIGTLQTNPEGQQVAFLPGMNADGITGEWLLRRGNDAKSSTGIDLRYSIQKPDKSLIKVSEDPGTSLVLAQATMGQAIVERAIEKYGTLQSKEATDYISSQRSIELSLANANKAIGVVFSPSLKTALASETFNLDKGIAFAMQTYKRGGNFQDVQKSLSNAFLNGKLKKPDGNLTSTGDVNGKLWPEGKEFIEAKQRNTRNQGVKR